MKKNNKPNNLRKGKHMLAARSRKSRQDINAIKTNIDALEIIKKQNIIYKFFKTAELTAVLAQRMHFRAEP